MSTPYQYALRRRSPFAPYDPNDPQATEQDQGMYAPSGPTPDASIGGSTPPPSMFTPAPTGPMPDLSPRPRPVSADMNVAPEIPQAPSMYSPAQPGPQSQPERRRNAAGDPIMEMPEQPNFKPIPQPGVFEPTGAYRARAAAVDAENKHNQSIYEKRLLLYQGQTNARALGETAPMESQITARILDPNTPPEEKAALWEKLQETKKFQQPPGKMAKYERSVEMIDGKPTVVWVNDNDPTDRHLGGAAAPHEFAPQRQFPAQAFISDEGMGMIFDPNSQRFRAAPLPGATTPPPDGGAAQAAPAAAAPPANSAVGSPAPAPSVAPAPSTTTTVPPPMPPRYTKIGAPATMSNVDIDSVAKDIASMDENNLNRANEIASRGGSEKARIFNRARQYNPNFNWAEVERKRKLLDGLTNGKDRDALRSFGVFLNHSAELMDVAQKFNQTTPALLSKSINWFKQNVTADPMYARVVAAGEPVGYEYMTFILGGKALQESERKEIENLNLNNLPLGQLIATVNQMGKTSVVRYNEIDNTFQNAFHKPLAQSTAISHSMSPDSIRAAQRIGLDLGGFAGMGQAVGTVSPSGKYRWDGKQWQLIR